MKKRLYARLALLCVMLLSVGCSGSTAQETTSAGTAAPNFTLEDINGMPVSLSDFKGNVIIVDFFATWCPPCRQEIPDFIELSRAYGTQGFTMIGISLEGPETTRKFSKELDIAYPVLIDDDRVSNAYGPIRAIPTTFVIDRNGNIVKQYVGFRPKEVFEADIKELL